MSEDQMPVTVNVLYDGSDLVSVAERGKYGATVVVVTDKATGHVMELPLNDAWFLSDMAGQAVQRAMQPPRTPEEEAPFTGTCPGWCESKNNHWFGEAWMEAHFARRGSVDTSAHVDDGEVLSIDVELFQECVGAEPACVALFTEWPDGNVRLSADEAELLGRRLLEASAELREYEARAAVRVPVAAGVGNRA